MGVVAKSPSIFDLVAEDVKVEQIARGCTFTEGPIWNAAGLALYCLWRWRRGSL